MYLEALVIRIEQTDPSNALHDSGHAKHYAACSLIFAFPAVTDEEKLAERTNRMEPNLVLKTAMRIAVLVLLLATAAASLCSTAEVRRTPAAAPDLSDPLADFIGLWTGTSTSTMNAAKVKISFNVKRKGNELKGPYRCAPLNAVCRNNVQSGWVRGTISARGFTVSMEDTSWCAFKLDRFYPEVGDGGYTCYMNGSIADRGTFEIKGPPSHSEATLSEKPR
jgi:hypothetical protein